MVEIERIADLAENFFPTSRSLNQMDEQNHRSKGRNTVLPAGTTDVFYMKRIGSVRRGKAKTQSPYKA